jgi:adenylate cyclase
VWLALRSHAKAIVLDQALLRPVRLWTGCTLFAYVLTHLLNHTLGNISVATMEQGLLIQKWIWQGWLGTTALYISAVTHALLGLWALYERRYFRWTPSEMVQLALGLCIPPMLANHITVTRLSLTAWNLDKGYAQELYALWVASVFWGSLQVIVLIVAWTHACMGLHFRLRLTRFYRHWERPLLCFAVLLPVLALLGFEQGGRVVAHDLQDPAWPAVNLASARTGTPAQVAWLAHARDVSLAVYAGLLMTVLAARAVRRWRETVRGLVQVVWLGGGAVRVPRGVSVLEASQVGKITHA